MSEDPHLPVNDPNVERLLHECAALSFESKTVLLRSLCDELGLKLSMPERVLSLVRKTDLLGLGEDVQQHLLTCLDPESLLRVGQTCKCFRSLATKDSIWRSHIEREFCTAFSGELADHVSVPWRSVFWMLLREQHVDDDLDVHLELLEKLIDDGPARRFLQGIAAGYSVPEPGNTFTFHAPSAYPVHYKWCVRAGWSWSADRVAWTRPPDTRVGGIFTGASLPRPNQQIVAALHRCREWFRPAALTIQSVLTIRARALRPTAALEETCCSDLLTSVEEESYGSYAGGYQGGVFTWHAPNASPLYLLHPPLQDSEWLWSLDQAMWHSVHCASWLTEALPLSSQNMIHRLQRQPRPTFAT